MEGEKRGYVDVCLENRLAKSRRQDECGSLALAMEMLCRWHAGKRVCLI